MENIQKLKRTLAEHVLGKRKINQVILSQRFYEEILKEHAIKAKIICRHIKVEIHEELQEDFIIR